MSTILAKIIELMGDNILLRNIPWMGWNTFLALIGLYFAWKLKSKKSGIIKKGLFFIGWLLFVPNSIYIVTDIFHLFEQWPYYEGWIRVGLFFEYLIFLLGGPITYYLSWRWAEIGLGWQRLKKRYYWAIIILGNLLMSFGVFMGRVERTNSWYVLSHPTRVIYDVVDVLMNPLVMFVVILFGFGSFIFYISARGLEDAWKRKSRI